MKVSLTTYSNTKDILKFPNPYVDMAVTVSDFGVVANAEGRKIVLAGTNVGGKDTPTLEDESQPVIKKNTASVAAVCTITFGAPDVNDTVTIGGNTYKYAAASSNPNEFSTADELAALINTQAEVTAVNNAGTITVTAVQLGTIGNSIATGKTGTGTLTITAFSGGTDGNAKEAEGVLAYDVDVTDGAAAGAMILLGFIALDKIPEVPAPEAKEALKTIHFIK